MGLVPIWGPQAQGKGVLQHHTLRILVPRAPWTEGLADGRVQVPGISYECVADSGQAPQRFAAAEKQAFDAGENGLRSILLELLQGGRARALPVWFGREHFQRNIIVREDSPFASPRDLAGKRVGTRQPIVAGTSVGVILVLEHGYGVPPDQIHWFVRAPDDLPVNRMGLDLHPGPPSTAAAFQQLLDGELDAVLVGGGPRYWSLFGPDSTDTEVAGTHGLRHLVDDPATIADVYRRSGLYPITDLVVLEPGLVDRHPAAPRHLMAAFSEANALASRYRSESEEHLARVERQLLGEDPHQYGLTANPRRNLALLIDLFYRLGAIECPLDPEALFVPSAL